MNRIWYALPVILLIGVPNIDGGQIMSSAKGMYDSLMAPEARLLTPEEGCGYSKVQNTRIVGGTAAKNGAWPWMALLFYFYGEIFKYDCGGSLITSKHVLTAAHCIMKNLAFVRLGEYDVRTSDNEPHEDVDILQVEVHEDFDLESLQNDIAILILERSVVFNDRIRPICLPFTEELINRRFVGFNPFIAGWGAMRENGTRSYKLMQIQLPVISILRCKLLYLSIGETDFPFDDRVLCAGFDKGGMDSCQGDSGGPVMLPIAGDNGTFPFYQIGIISWGEGCAQPNLPSVDTNVQYYADWIYQKLSL